MRIALINVVQETNDFNPALSDLDAFKSFGIVEGLDILEIPGGVSTLDGYKHVVATSDIDIETVPIIRAFTVAGGRISREAFDVFHRKIREGLEAAGRIDALMLQLHGACAAEGIDDVEGEQVELCRQILGPDIPIVLTLDHHANVTGKIVDNCDAIVGHRTQPHDLFDTGKIGAEVLLRLVRDGAKPTMTWRKIPMISHQEQFLTAKPPMKIWFDRAREMEKDPRVIQCSNYPMQPWLDVTEGGWATVVVTDNDPGLANELADELASLAWSMRARFQVKDAVAVDDAVRAADAAAKGIVILSDTGDTVFGGAAGDSNILLEAILRLKPEGRALVPLISAKAAAQLAEAGVGAEVTLPLGGDVATKFFTPLEVTGTVRFVGEGPVTVAGYHHQSEVDMGTRVVFEAGPATILITQYRGVAGNMPEVYTASGVDIGAHKMAVLKTASNFQFFDAVSSEVIRVDTRGPGQSDIQTLPWQRLPRPIYPLDDIADWKPS